MVKFNTALKWLEEGKKVRRPNWKEDSYWIFGQDQVIMFKGIIIAKVHLNQIKADNWEIYEEEQSPFDPIKYPGISQITPEKLARVFHDAYEKISKQQGWKTQKKCQVKFDDLPIENKNAMIMTAKEVIHYLEEVK